MTKRALITGITGQDGSYLAELLLEKGYRVFGLARRSSSSAHERIAHLGDDVTLLQGDLLDEGSLGTAVRTSDPTEVYNLAAQSQVHTSFAQPVFTADINGLGVTRLLNAVMNHNPDIRFFQASSSEIFGRTTESPQNETTALHPRSPYGVAKAYAHLMIDTYREAHHMHASAGIVYNHESPRRSDEFVTRKITSAAASIKLGLMTELRLGSLEGRRDWGFAGDYVHAMWQMLQLDEPQDFVIATGRSHSVRDFCELAFGRLDLDYRDYVVHDDSQLRPVEAELLVGDITKAKQLLGWTPTLRFEELVAMMVDADTELLESTRR